MSKGRNSTSVNLGVKSRQRSTIVLEASPSVEIASYDYEATPSQPELAESVHADEKRAKTNLATNGPFEKRDETTPRNLGNKCTPKTVCFSTNDQSFGKLTTGTELTSESSSRQKIIQQECAACKTIVNESGDEGEIVDVNTPVANSKSKELSKNPVVPVSKVKKRGQVSSARRENNSKNILRVKTSLKDLARRKGVDPSLLVNNRNSKIPRATTITCAAARVYPIARIPSRGNSKTSFCTRSFFTTRSKPTNISAAESNLIPVSRTCDILKQIKGSNAAIVDVKLAESKASSSKKEQYADAKCKINPQSPEESPRTQVGSAGDHPSPPSTSSALKNLRLNSICRSCNDGRETVNLKLSIHDVQDPWSDSKSSPEIRSPNRWYKTSKTKPYVESTSEEIDLSSEYSSDSSRPMKKKCFVGKESLRSPISKPGYTRNSPRPRPRRR